MAKASQQNREYLFSEAPVLQALYAFAAPTILGQLVTLVYNLTDTYFVGRANDPAQVAAVSLCFPIFHLINALANLYGVGAGSLISRLLGAGRRETVKNCSAFAVYAALITAALYSIVLSLFMPELVSLSGAEDAATAYHCSVYFFWVAVVGGIPTMFSLTMTHLLRADGHSKEAGRAMMTGGIANIILDAFAVCVLKMELRGAAIATMLSNLISCGYCLYVISKIRADSPLSFRLRDFSARGELLRPIFSVGLPSALLVILACTSNIVFNNCIAPYGSTAQAAAGIAKKLDTLPLNVTLGLCQGTMPLVAYNYAAKNYRRMNAVTGASLGIGIGFCLVCILCFCGFTRAFISPFIEDRETVEYGIEFLRLMILATPMITVNLYVNSFFQGTGNGKISTLLSVCRQGVVYIPVIFLMDRLFGLYGVVASQLAADSITMLISLALFFRARRQRQN